MEPRILLFDIETFANKGETWGMYEQNVIRITREWELASFAYKWLGESKITCITREGQKTDKALAKALHKVLSQADIVIAHNGDSFDNKKARTRMLFHGLAPLKPYKQIDTKKMAKSRFAMNSNSLDALGKFLGVGRKRKTGGYELWEDCMDDKPAAWKKMAAYNKQDVVLLERVYLKLRPHDHLHPSVAVFGNLNGCPKCGSLKLQSRGLACSNSATYRRWQCMGCGGWSRSVKALNMLGKPKVVNG